MQLQVGTFIGELLRESAIGHEQLSRPADDKKAGFAGEPGEIRDVDRIGNEQGVEPERLELAGESFAAGGGRHREA